MTIAQRQKLLDWLKKANYNTFNCIFRKKAFIFFYQMFTFYRNTTNSQLDEVSAYKSLHTVSMQNIEELSELLDEFYTWKKYNINSKNYDEINIDVDWINADDTNLIVEILNTTESIDYIKNYHYIWASKYTFIVECDVYDNMTREEVMSMLTEARKERVANPIFVSRNENNEITFN